MKVKKLTCLLLYGIIFYRVIAQHIGIYKRESLHENRKGETMRRQLEIFYNLVLEFKKDTSIDAVLLNGSVAFGTATDLSDLDIIVLGKRNDFVSQLIDGVLVEIHYTTFDKAIGKLKSNPMEIYKYLDAKIEYDNGKAQEIIIYAETVLEHYCASKKERSEICYWLKSTRMKLESAFSKQDVLLISYLVTTNTWKVLEGVWAVNKMPVSPSSSLYRRYSKLKLIPCQEWFEKLLIGSAENRGSTMIDIIDWILQKLNESLLSC